MLGWVAAVIDTDPVFTQLRMMQDADFVNYYRQFDAVATFGRLIGTQQCPLPTHGNDYLHGQISCCRRSCRVAISLDHATRMQPPECSSDRPPGELSWLVQSTLPDGVLAVGVEAATSELSRDLHRAEPKRIRRR